MARITTTRLMTILLLAALAPFAAAEDQQPSSIALETPDFSEEALLEILKTETIDVEIYEDRLELRWAEWILRFLPLVLPLTLNDGTYGSAQINTPVNGLALLGVDYPLAGPAGDEIPPEALPWRERRFRIRMIGEVNRANERDNREN